MDKNTAVKPQLLHEHLDPEVWGHAVKALRKAKIAGYKNDVAQVARTADGWIRRAAQKYLQEMAD
ncbi:MAG TPA: hypothetical protein VN811_03665 [Thermoanaerobaculia bacterium]|nr:hypothetical protein [Thermoanaerobaculia bacterium]